MIIIIIIVHLWCIIKLSRPFFPAMDINFIFARTKDNTRAYFYFMVLRTMNSNNNNNNDMRWNSHTHWKIDRQCNNKVVLVIHFLPTHHLVCQCWVLFSIAIFFFLFWYINKVSLEMKTRNALACVTIESLMQKMASIDCSVFI